jgi:hypothetical protein
MLQLCQHNKVYDCGPSEGPSEGCSVRCTGPQMLQLQTGAAADVCQRATFTWIRWRWHGFSVSRVPLNHLHAQQAQGGVQGQAGEWVESD